MAASQFVLVDGFKVPQGAECDRRVLWVIQQLKARSRCRSGEVTVTPAWVQVWCYPRVTLPQVDIDTAGGREQLELVIEGLLATVNRYYVTPGASRLALPPGAKEAMQELIQGAVIWMNATNARHVVTPRNPSSVVFEASADGAYLRWTCYWTSYDVMEAPDCVGGAVRMPAAGADFRQLARDIAANANAQANRGCSGQLTFTTWAAQAAAQVVTYITMKLSLISRDFERSRV